MRPIKVNKSFQHFPQLPPPPHRANVSEQLLCLVGKGRCHSPQSGGGAEQVPPASITTCPLSHPTNFYSELNFMAAFLPNSWNSNHSTLCSRQVLFLCLVSYYPSGLRILYSGYPHSSPQLQLFKVYFYGRTLGG